MHQLEWGEDKCKVMEIGKHKEKKTQKTSSQTGISGFDKNC